MFIMCLGKTENSMVCCLGISIFSGGTCLKKISFFSVGFFFAFAYRLIRNAGFFIKGLFYFFEDRFCVNLPLPCLGGCSFDRFFHARLSFHYIQRLVCSVFFANLLSRWYYICANKWVA